MRNVKARHFAIIASGILELGGNLKLVLFKEAVNLEASVGRNDKENDKHHGRQDHWNRRAHKAA